MKKLIVYLLVLVISVQLVACTSVPTVTEPINQNDFVSKKEYETLNELYNAVKESLESIKENNGVLQSNLQKIQNDYTALSKQYDDMEADFLKLQANYEEKRATYDALLEDFQNVTSNHEEAKTALEASKAALETAKAEFDAIQATYKSLKASYDELKELYEKNIGGVVPPIDEPTGDFNEAEVLSQLKVTRYDYHYFGDEIILIIENSSKFRLSIQIEVKLYDGNGQMNGYKTLKARPVDRGTKTIVRFSYDEPFAKMEYTISAEEEEYYTCGTGNLSYTSIPAKNKEILTVTNNGIIAIEFVEVYVLFFKGDKIVYRSANYFIDDDSELKPGKSETREVDCSEEYDSFLVIFTGRAS